jgi:hypothetical protein
MNPAPFSSALSSAPTGGTAGKLLGMIALGWVCLAGPSSVAADVVGYSIIKGEFLLQTGTGPGGLERDPDFGFSILATVELADFDLLDSARLRLPEGDTLEMDDYGDYWSILDSYGTAAELDEAYSWGDYVVLFEAPTDGKFSCLVGMPEAALPPAPRLVNFADVQSVDAAQPLTVTWEFDGTPAKDDFVQVYVNLGHGEVFATPNLGEPGALGATDRSVTIPPDLLVPGFIHSLNLEITRVVSTNTACHPSAQGVGAVFRSTEIDVFVPTPPEVRWLAKSTNGLPAVEVVTDPEQPIVLQGSPDLRQWSDVATNAAASGTNVFEISTTGDPRRFYRAVLR